MRNLIIFVILSVFLLECNKSNKTNPIGFWQGSTGELIITENKDNFVLNREGQNTEYILKSSDKIQIIDNELKIEHSNKEISVFKKIDSKQDLKAWAVLEGMNKSFFRDNFISPDTIIISQAGAEKWFFQNGKVLIFDENTLIKINESQKLVRTYDKLKIGMTEEEVKHILGNPDRKNYMESKWYYGTEKQLLFRNKTLYQINKIDENTGVLSWREEALKTFNDKHLVEKDIATYLSQIHKLEKQFIINFPLDKIYKLYGIQESKKEYIPMILIGEVDQISFPPSMYIIEKELEQFGPDIEKQILQSYSAIVSDVSVSEPQLDKRRQLIELTSSILLKSGERIFTKQAIFFRYNQMLLIQMSTQAEEKKYMSYYNEILTNFDI